MGGKHTILIIHFSITSLVTLQWDTERDRISALFVAFRLLMAAVSYSILEAVPLLRLNISAYFFIYFTNIGFTLQTLHFVVSAIVPINYLFQAAKGQGKIF